ncbi:MAG: hypothetical protein KKB81_07110 [Candidatus Margulisbacteria bacterium]|nr:hypothetical protein [Candidatus Margulisiibacteriota bacterium]MBU1021912.1 hypothetical protein [Candidatus Margulisiibacteriota bacterium]MBU1728550.1 hypothetical protein [Candidatus Margulisiibacteriota bacterium]MBU1954697.1 hypothetical protein [Candidatus Margulisiibacteriota bacterium]
MLDLTTNDLINFEIQEKETHLKVFADADLAEKALALLFNLRSELETFIATTPRFKEAYSPVNVPFRSPQLIKNMAWAARKGKVGPMASVAGAIAELIGKELLKYSKEVIVINGNDAFVQTDYEREFAIPNSNYMLKIDPRDCPMAFSTLTNLGTAEALVVKSKSGALADAAATAIGNVLRDPIEYDDVMKLAKKIRGLKGVLFTKGDFIGAIGKMDIRSKG